MLLPDANVENPVWALLHVELDSMLFRDIDRMVLSMLPATD
jgi:hypothetical protein